MDGYLYKGIHDSHCDYDTIGDLDDLATMLTIANMMTMITTMTIWLFTIQKNVPCIVLIGMKYEL